MFALNTLIVKTTYKCNLSCAYCYEKQKIQNKKIPFSIVEDLLIKISKFPNDTEPCRIIWHGGEPLLMGLGFYKRVVEFQQKINYPFVNSVQTNADLLNDEFIDFFVENNFKVGISLDGPKVVHDMQRFDHMGQPSFNRIYNNILKFKAHPKYPHKNISIISVFTKNTLDNINEFYNFVKENHFDVHINDLLISGNGIADIQLSPTEYAKGLITLFDIWINDKNNDILLHPFSEFIEGFVHGHISICNFSGNCYDNFWAIDPDGDIFPCGKWSKDDYFFGNIKDIEFESIYGSDTYFDLKRNKLKLLSYCQGCKYSKICNGGCYFIQDYSKYSKKLPNMYCETYKLLFSHIEKVLSNILN